MVQAVVTVVPAAVVPTHEGLSSVVRRRSFVRPQDTRRSFVRPQDTTEDDTTKEETGIVLQEVEEA